MRPCDGRRRRVVPCGRRMDQMGKGAVSDITAAQVRFQLKVGAVAGVSSEAVQMADYRRWRTLSCFLMRNGETGRALPRALLLACVLACIKQSRV